MIRLLLLVLLLVPTLAWAGPPYEPQGKVAIKAYNQGAEALDRGLVKQAAAGAKRCLKAEPDRGICQNLLATAWSRDGRVDDAVELLREVTSAYPEELGPLLTLTVALFSAQRFDEADAASQAAVTAAPFSLHALRGRQLVLGRLGRYDKQLALLAAAWEQSPRPELRCMEAEMWVAKHEIERARGLLPACRTAEDPAFIANAEATFSKATGEGTQGAQALVQLLDKGDRPVDKAVGAYSDGHFAEAERWATRAVADGRNARLAHITRALSLHRLGRGEEALGDLDAALSDETWIDMHDSGVMRGILTRESELLFEAELGRAAVLRTALLVEADRLPEARVALTDGQAAFPEGTSFSGVRALVELADGQALEAWADAVQGLGADDDEYADRAASELSLHHLGQSTAAQRAEVAKLGSIVTRYNLGAGMSNVGDAAGCEETLRPLVGSEDTVAQRSGDDPAAARALLDVQVDLNLLAHSCAAGAQDLEAARRWWPLLGPPEAIPPSNAINHALLLLRAGQTEEAWTTLQASKATQRAQGQPLEAALQVAVGAAIDTRRWDEVRALCQRAETPATSRLSGGTALGGAGRKAAAVAILKGACPALSGEARDICTNNVRVFSQ